MDPRVSKTAGLIEILKLHHIDLKEIVTFGDADNDYDMTLNAGIGVVMVNGSDKTKSVADYITDDNDHDDIGNYIEKFINNFSDCKDVFIMKNDEHYDVYIGKIENMIENIENLSLLDRLILSKAASIITSIIN